MNKCKCGNKIANYYAKQCEKCYIKSIKVKKIKTKCLLCNKSIYDYSFYKRKFCCLSHSYTYRLKLNFLNTTKILSKLNDKIFLSWLTAFWEGEGSLSVSYKKRRYNFNITQKNYQIIKYIKNKLKIGRIYKHTANGCYSFIINDNGTILALLYKIKKYFRINRRKKQINKYLNSRRIKELLRYV